MIGHQKNEASNRGHNWTKSSSMGHYIVIKGYEGDQASSKPPAQGTAERGILGLRGDV